MTCIVHVSVLFHRAQYFGVNIGPVHKRDVMKASVMLEHKKEWVATHTSVAAIIVIHDIL